MFIIEEILIPRSSGVNLAPLAVKDLKESFEQSIKLSMFAFPYNPDKHQYVVNVREEDGMDTFLLIIDPNLLPNEGQLFVCVIDNIPMVKKYNSEVHHNLKIFGTVAHASKAATVNID